jgi:hypothetical protein
VTAQEPSRKKQATQERGSGVSSGTSSSGASNAEVEKQASELTLVKLQEYLNATEEDAIQHGTIAMLYYHLLQKETCLAHQKPKTRFFSSNFIFKKEFSRFHVLWLFFVRSS